MKRINFLFSILFFTATVSNLSAFIFEPPNMDFSTTGVMSGHYYHVNNITNETIRLNIKVYEIRISENGNEELIDNSTDFFIFPNDLTLEAKEEKNIRVQYTGSKDIRNEAMYKIVINQIPIDFEGENFDEVYLPVSYNGYIKVIPDL